MKFRSEEELSRQQVLDLEFSGELCLSMTMPQSEMYLKCNAEDKLIIDAPNVTTLWSTTSNLCNISYLPSLSKCDIGVLQSLRPLLTEEMKQKADNMQRKLDNWQFDEESLLHLEQCELSKSQEQCELSKSQEQCELDEWMAYEEAEGEYYQLLEDLEEFYLQCYHELCACS